MKFTRARCILAVFFAVLSTQEHTLTQAGFFPEEHKTQIKDKHYFTKKCECRVETWDGLILHEFGVIDTYSFPETSCHKVHRKCRHACAAKLDLGDILDGFELGHHYCRRYGKPTPPGGVTLVAVWKPKYCPHHAEQDSSKEVQLCCGPQADNNIHTLEWKDCIKQG